MTSGISCSILYQCLVRQRILFASVFGTFFVFSVVLGSTMDTWTPGDDFRIVSVFIAELGSTADTCTASVYEAFWMLGFSLGDDFRIVSAFSAELGSTVDTCWLQSMRLLEEFLAFST